VSAKNPSCRPEIAMPGDVDVDDLAVLINGPIDVAPPAGDLHIGLVGTVALSPRATL
jgi:hypothetical protein